jgi:NADPH:quinone reductase-like Zn-dependent oxidoreductase
MKAAIVTGPNKTPVYGDFDEPSHQDGFELINVTASALTNITRARAAGTHYSAEGVFPLIPGADGVGRTDSGQRVMFQLPDAPYGGMAERTRVRSDLCFPLPDNVDDVVAAAIANPGMSPIAALRERAELREGETVLINGATGVTGQLAVQIAKILGAQRVIATGRDDSALEDLRALGADVTINLREDPDARLRETLTDEYVSGDGIDVILDYLYGQPAETLLSALASIYKGHKAIRYVMGGGVSGTSITLPSTTIATMPLTIRGSGIGSLPFDRFLQAASDAIKIAAATGLHINYTAVPLREVETAWHKDYGRSRVVFTLE